MSANLHRLFGLHRPQPTWTSLPAARVGGLVYTQQHHDGLEDYVYWSVNWQAANRDSGWQSHRLYTAESADAAASVLAEYLGAELVFA